MSITERKISTDLQIGAPILMPDGREHSGVLFIAPQPFQETLPNPTYIRDTQMSTSEVTIDSNIGAPVKMADGRMHSGVLTEAAAAQLAIIRKELTAIQAQKIPTAEPIESPMIAH